MIGGVEAVRGWEAIESLQGGRCRGMSAAEGGAELADPFALLDDQTEIDDAAAAPVDIDRRTAGCPPGRAGCPVDRRMPAADAGPGGEGSVDMPAHGHGDFRLDLSGELMA